GGACASGATGRRGAGRSPAGGSADTTSTTRREIGRPRGPSGSRGRRTTDYSRAGVALLARRGGDTAPVSAGCLAVRPLVPDHAVPRRAARHRRARAARPRRAAALRRSPIPARLAPHLLLLGRPPRLSR